MRLWHEQIIHLLPKNQLLGQHRECCALRGNGWKKKHKTVDYVFLYSPYVNVNIKMYKKWKIKMYNLGSTIHQLSYHQ